MIWKPRRKPKKQIQDPMSKSPGTGLVAITTTVAPTKKNEFKGFPLDIINMFFNILFEQSELSTILCLALTCRTCWSFFQGKPWKENVKFSRWPRSTQLIESWIGPDYRRTGRNSWYIETLFLSRAVYGDFPGVEEKELNDRWEDYHTLSSREDETHWLTCHVPKPFRVTADKWFRLAALQLKNEVLSWDSWTRKRENLAASYRRSNLYSWLLSNGGQEWLFSHRDYQRTMICNDDSMAVLIYFPDEGQSWPMGPERSKPTGKGTNARKLRRAGR